MGSKYDVFWLSIIDVVADLIEEAFIQGRSRAIDVSGIRGYGDRLSWYGSVVVSRDGVIRGDMAHARSLGKVLVRMGILDRFGGSVFVIRITNKCSLYVELLSKDGVSYGKSMVRVRRSSGGDKPVDESVDESIYFRIHELLELLPMLTHDFRLGDVPSNGLYFFYEEGETLRLGKKTIKRIVRVGTHREKGRLPLRLTDHFRGNRNTSIFRKHLGDALLERIRQRPHEAVSMLSLSRDDIERLVSRELRERFSFKVVKVDDTKERLELEERLIATLARFSPKYVSPNWLGRYSPNERIRRSGLWNVESVDSRKVMTPEHMKRFEQLIYRTLLGDTGPALILIPCSKSKTVTPSNNSFTEPIPEITHLRAKLLEKLKSTPELKERPDNRDGVLNEGAQAVKAINLYSGRFYVKAREALLDIHNGKYPYIRVLIVSALYGLAELGEGLKKYDLTMTDKLADGEKVYEFWVREGLWKILLKYIISNKVSTVWSLLPNSQDFPYHQVFKELWNLLEGTGIRCFHVEFPGAGTSTGIRRAEWLVHTIKNDPVTLVKGPRGSKDELPGHKPKYVPCREVC